MARADYVTIIEALYAVEAPEREWLLGVVRSTAAGMGLRHRGAYAITYDASDIHDFRLGSFAATDQVDPALVRHLEVDFPAVYRAEPALVEAVMRRVPFGPSRTLPQLRNLEGVHALLARFGVHEILGVNGVNVDGRGAHVGLLMSGPSRVDPDTLARVSSHLAAAARLRLRLDGAPPMDRADAVLDPNGKVAYATRGAKLREARDALGGAARRLERIRGPLRRRDPEKAARQWRALIEGHWSLIDHFDSDGRRFLLAQANAPALAPLAVLSERERQVVALVAIGHANKLIAYELGIAVSTVGVLLGRAARKLGARTRREVAAAYRAATTE